SDEPVQELPTRIVDEPLDDKLSHDRTHKLEEIKQFKLRRTKDQKETDEIMNQYIEENKSLQKMKEGFIEDIGDFLFVYAIKGKNLLYLHMRCMLTIMSLLCKIYNYHDKDINWTKDKC